MTAPIAARASKTARPATVPARPPTAMHRPSTALQHASAAQHASPARHGIRPTPLAESEFIASPFCEHCGTDEFIYLETFVPATHHRDGSVSKLGEVTYFCSGCDDFSAHAVPATWVPPGWYFG